MGNAMGTDAGNALGSTGARNDDDVGSTTGTANRLGIIIPV